MSGFERQEHIARSHPEVWNFFVDYENASKWMPDIVRLEKITDGPVGKGTKFRETRRMGKKEHTVTLEITEFDEGRRYAGTVEEMGIRGTYTYEFEPRGSETEVSLTAEISGRGMAKLMVPLAKRAMVKIDGDQLARLKRAVEHS